MKIAIACALCAAALAAAVACKSDAQLENPMPTLFQVHEETERMDAAAREVFTDPDRAERFIALLDSVREVEAAHVELLERSAAELDRLNRDYDTPREDFEALYDQVQFNVEISRQLVLARFVRLQELVTDDEWSRLLVEMAAIDPNWKVLVQ